MKTATLAHMSTLVLCLMVAVPGADCRGGILRAYSLHRAEQQLMIATGSDADVNQLGGITRLAGMVHDRATGDLIIIGAVKQGQPPVQLDELVVAMRALMVQQQWPAVSIDRTRETPKTGRQMIRYSGGIENTVFGQRFLEADVTLKRLGLGTLRTGLAGVVSYFDMSLEEAIANSVAGDQVNSRFWWYAMDPFVTVREGVFVIESLRVGARTQIVSAHIGGHVVDDVGKVEDRVGDAFAESLTTHYEELALEFPELGRLKTLFDLVAVAYGIQSLQERPNVDFWLHRYQVTKVETPQDYAVLSRPGTFGNGDRQFKMVLDGGIESRALLIRLRGGDVTALRDVVLRSRPSQDSLTWEVPVGSWELPGIRNDGYVEASEANDCKHDRLGCTIQKRLMGSSEDELSMLGADAATFAPQLPDFRISERLTSWPVSTDIGGVMLSGAANVEGAGRAEESLTGGNFALVVDGKDARIDPQLFRKFVTALWCVYYAEQDPGISIDPIGPMGPDSDKHLVRYIGRVVNTDLGRVMREADYVMKKWAVGTERPDFRGFQPVDGWMAKYGASRSGVSRRFWFVPEDIRFTQDSGLLMFADGRMRLNTEYDIDGLRGQASKADEQFAQFFTEHYSKLAEKYPVYKELFEYAKLVALARHLKEQGVPLHWFLLAHKDLVITEDSPGTVDQLARGSEYFQGMTIMGGVDLNPRSQYVYDGAAMAAIQRALAAQQAAGSRPATSLGGAEHSAPVQRVSFDVGRKSYTVLPQTSLTSGKDHRGLRYQTDVALRSAGQAGLELVRYFDPRQRSGGQFGRGWHLLIPYRVKPDGQATRQFLNAEIPERMIVENLLSGHQEVFSFSADRYAAAGYVPEKVESSQVIGLFLMSNGSFRLADKLGNQFHFDPTGRMTDMCLSMSPDHHLHIEYADEFTAALAESPYQVRPAGEEQVPFLNVRLPKRVEVTDLIHDYHEVLTFSDAGEIAGYRPADGTSSRFPFLAVLTNGGLQLTDKGGNEIRFDPGWDFESLLPARDRHMARSVTMGTRKVTFGYTIDQQGEVVIATSAVSEDEPHAAPMWVVRYDYDAEGRLCEVHRPQDPVAAHEPPQPPAAAFAAK